RRSGIGANRKLPTSLPSFCSAPIPAVRRVTIESLESTHSRPSAYAAAMNKDPTLIRRPSDRVLPAPVGSAAARNRWLHGGTGQLRFGASPQTRRRPAPLDCVGWLPDIL